MFPLGARFVVLDFETNGLAASRGGEVIETGAVRLDDDRAVLDEEVPWIVDQRIGQPQAVVSHPSSHTTTGW